MYQLLLELLLKGDHLLAGLLRLIVLSPADRHTFTLPISHHNDAYCEDCIKLRRASLVQEPACKGIRLACLQCCFAEAFQPRRSILGSHKD